VTTSIAIRAVRRDDFAAWRQLWDGYNAFYGRSGDSALPAEITLITWERFFDGAEPMHALVADRSGTLLGLAHYLYHRSTIMASPICYLQDLFTADAERGQGIGRALIHAVYECASSDGATRVYWQTHETNAVARRLYDQVAEQSGFIVYRQNL
jgi:GNAT superfamily N-acetyltransferase